MPTVVKQFDEGYDARLAGKRQIDNPYPEGSLNNECWSDGWWKAGQASSVAFVEVIKQVPAYERAQDYAKDLARVFFELGFRAGKKSKEKACQ